MTCKLPQKSDSYKLDKIFNFKLYEKNEIHREPGQMLVQPIGTNISWSMDFISDSLASGKRFKMLNLLDDFNREILHNEIATGLSSQRVVRVLEELEEWRGLPRSIRVDNGPEFISYTLSEWCREKDIELQFIQPGRPMQNGYVERFNKTYRNEILDRFLFSGLEEVREITLEWMDDYNNFPS